MIFGAIVLRIRFWRIDMGCGTCGYNSCNCSCGRKTVMQQSAASCCNTSAGTRFCKEPVVYVTGDFTVPAANVEVEISVSSSAKLYLGQGISIGGEYFKITEIVDSLTIKAAHDGTATPATVIKAMSPTYGCYQYPIYYVGEVELIFEPDYLEGVDQSFDEVTDSVIDPEVSFTYGYLGPNKIQFNLEIQCEIDNTPHFVEVALPEAGTSPLAAFSAVLIISGVPYPLVAYKRGAKLIVGPGSTTAFTDGAGRTILVSGEYGV